MRCLIINHGNVFVAVILEYCIAAQASTIFDAINRLTYNFQLHNQFFPSPPTKAPDYMFDMWKVAIPYIFEHNTFQSFRII